MLLIPHGCEGEREFRLNLIYLSNSLVKCLLGWFYECFLLALKGRSDCGLHHMNNLILLVLHLTESFVECLLFFLKSRDLLALHTDLVSEVFSLTLFCKLRPQAFDLFRRLCVNLGGRLCELDSLKVVDVL